MDRPDSSSVGESFVDSHTSPLRVGCPTRRKRASVALPILRPTRLPWGEVTGGHTIASPMPFPIEPGGNHRRAGPCYLAACLIPSFFSFLKSEKDAEGVSDRTIRWHLLKCQLSVLFDRTWMPRCIDERVSRFMRNIRLLRCGGSSHELCEHVVRP